MARMSPAAYDSWWKTRIVKEETDYANHILKNWELQRSGAGSSNPITQELTLNSIGAPQLTAPKNLIQQQIVTKHSTSGPLVDTKTSSSNGGKPPRGPGSPVQSRPVTAALAVGGSRPGSRAGSLAAAFSSKVPAVSVAKVAAAGTLTQDCDEDCLSAASGVPRSVVSKASRISMPAAARSAVGSMVRSDASYPRTPKFSEVGSSVAAFEVMSRLARLEADLAIEKQKRQAAEAEMRQLLASRGGNKPAMG